MKLVAGAPAAVIGGRLLIADVHLGIEFELRKKGVNIGGREKPEATKINDLLESARADELWVLGDLKHDVRGFEKQERFMMHRFLKELDAEKVFVVKGNHDSLLEKMRGITVFPPQGTVIEEGGKSYGLVHGHAAPSKKVLEANRILCGHQHPRYSFKDSLGSWSVPCWVKTGKTLVFPAFGELSGGAEANKKKFIGPLLKNAGKTAFYGLDGVKISSTKH